MCGWMKRIAKKWEAERLIAIDRRQGRDSR